MVGEGEGKGGAGSLNKRGGSLTHNADGHRMHSFNQTHLAISHDTYSLRKKTKNEQQLFNAEMSAPE